jgi:two-component system nitrate/nitrite response regulator NarL
VPPPPSKRECRAKIRLLVIADVKLYRDGMVNSLSRRDTIDVAGSAQNFEEAMRLIESANPDVVVLDMATRDSLDILRAISGHAAGVKTVAFAVSDCAQEIFACVDAGVAGYVSRDASMDDLVLAVQSVIRGDLPVPPRIAAALFRRLAVLRKDEREGSVWTLTARERQILLLIDEGLCNKEIAARLNIEVATVKNHVHSVLTKMHVTTRGQAAARLGTTGSLPRERAGLPHARQFIA